LLGLYPVLRGTELPHQLRTANIIKLRENHKNTAKK
jgi:hypothetical protein